MANNDRQTGMTWSGIFLYLVLLALCMWAVILSFQCKKGFELGDFLLACCCSPFYIAYRLGVGC